MPLNKNIKKVLLIGSGPIVIGQAAEFDYSGTQAIAALKEEGIEVILINSNPATIMTDTSSKDNPLLLADKVYIEPLTKEFLLKIIYKERPDGILASLGGQTALNLALELHRSGMLIREGVVLLGINSETIEKAEDRSEFKKLMQEIGEPVPRSTIVNTYEEARAFADQEGFPLIIRPAYTLGGTGGGIAHNAKEYLSIVQQGLDASPISQCLIEKSIAGWKEIEYEIIRDKLDNCISICNMENIDPVGVHTGDSIVVAPSQTLNDLEYQMLRQVSIKIVRQLKIVGACNVQLALHPNSGEYFIIEVNPRVSRSSALASKATGYPIAKVATKLALGYHLDEITNPVTKSTSAAFEPALDYVVVKIPRWPFDKFIHADRTLGTQMKATGEIMSLGRCLEEALLKGVRSLELGLCHLELPKLKTYTDQGLKNKLINPDDERLFAIAELMRRGFTIPNIEELTQINPFFLQKIKNIIEREKLISERYLTSGQLRIAKELGFTDQKIAELKNTTTEAIREQRLQANILPVYKMVDTCAAEFTSNTPYFYSTYEQTDESIVSTQKKVVIIGSGPIRIGQGIEFDYSTVHAITALRKAGYQAIIINNNPETVSTDFNISDKLYFEPLHSEDVLNILYHEKPDGVIVQFGGQTAINLAQVIDQHGFKILGSSLNSIDLAEDRSQFESLLNTLDIAQPLGTTIKTADEAIQKATHMGYPLMLRPSYVIGGQSMEIVYNQEELENYLKFTVNLNETKSPVLMDRYLIGTEVEVDAISDGESVFIPGIMEHIEKAGVHSGDSFAVYPPQKISVEQQNKLIEMTTTITKALKIVGLINLQFVIHQEQVFLLEVNPRASRTVPFLSKVTKVPMAQVATQVMLGSNLQELGYFHGHWPESEEISIKAPVFSFAKLRNLDIALGPEMKSTGEVMGKDITFPKALKKAFLASYVTIPEYGNILITISDKDKTTATITLLQRFYNAGFSFYATAGTANFLAQNNLPAKVVSKIAERGMTLLDEIKNKNVHLIINTINRGKAVESDGFKIRRCAVENGILCLTSLDTTEALLTTIEMTSLGVVPL